MSNDPDDIAARLGQVQDDVGAIDECRQWVAQSLGEGIPAEDLLAQLLAAGWRAEQAEPLIDDVRRRTREDRGVLGARDRATAATSHRPALRQIRAPDLGSAVAANLIFAAGRAIERRIGADADLIRARVHAGLCHKCAADVRRHQHQCPQCGAPILGPNVVL
jgi:hypothetical protein